MAISNDQQVIQIDSSDGEDPVVVPSARSRRRDITYSKSSSDPDRSVNTGRTSTQAYHDDHSQHALTGSEDDRTKATSDTEREDTNSDHFEQQTFRKLLYEFENAEDRAKLYPRSLWADDQAQAVYMDEEDILHNAFPGEGPAGASRKKSTKTTLEYSELVITHFCVYHSIQRSETRKSFQGQYRSLYTVRNGSDSDQAMLDGELTYGTSKTKVHAAEIVAVSIGGLDKGCPGHGDLIWIKTRVSDRFNCWYLLAHPCSEYEPYFTPFLWVANLGKHVVDFLEEKAEAQEAVGLEHFRSSFMLHISAQHQDTTEFKTWLEPLDGLVDFRQHIVRHHEWLYKLYYDIPGRLPDLHILWDEVGVTASVDSSASDGERTVVTAYAADTFLSTFPVWGPGQYNLLEVKEVAVSVDQARAQRRRALDFPDFTTSGGPQDDLDVTFLLEKFSQPRDPLHISLQSLPGAVVLVRHKSYESSRGAEVHYSYAYVKQVFPKGNLKVVWLVCPSETECVQWTQNGTKLRTFYPIRNELFFSDRCNCQTIVLKQVVGIFSATIPAVQDPVCQGLLLIRMRYLAKQSCFVTPLANELDCLCQFKFNRRSDVPGPGIATAQPQRSPAKEA